MKRERYRKVKGWKRDTTGRPVYMVRMSEAEIAGRRITIGICCSVMLVIGSIILWGVSMI